MTTIVIGGDIYPVGKVQNAFTEGKADEIFHDLLNEIVSADFSIVNLESPLVSQETPIAKAGPVMGAPIKTINGFVSAKWNVLNLANNHSFDHGASGLRETINTIKEAGLCVVGAGTNIKEAQTPLVKQINGRRIVIYSMAEHEFSVADENTPGANPLDIINFVHAIRLYKQQGIFIVLIHGGSEYYPYPSPEMVRRCHFMVDMGADAVICCHAHCPQPWEIYAEKPIVYGLGNLIFEADRMEPDVWYEGYLAKLIFEENNTRLEVIPYVQSLMNIGAQKMDEKKKKNFFNEMQIKNSAVKNIPFLEEQWLEYCRQQKDGYLTCLFGYNRLMRKARSFFLKVLHSKRDVFVSLNLTQCETHQERLNSILKYLRSGG